MISNTTVAHILYVYLSKRQSGQIYNNRNKLHPGHSLLHQELRLSMIKILCFVLTFILQNSYYRYYVNKKEENGKCISSDNSLKPNLQWDGNRRWGLLGKDSIRKAMRPKEWDQCLIKETPFTPAALCGYREKTAVYEPGSKLSTKH